MEAWSLWSGRERSNARPQISGSLVAFGAQVGSRNGPEMSLLTPARIRAALTD